MSTDLTQPLGAFVRSVSGKTTRNATPMEFWQGLSSLVVERIADAWHATERTYELGRRAAYFSAEFLMGRALLNNLTNLGLLDDAREALTSYGQNLTDVLEQEPDAALGNGGLGRLAACFIDSLAAHRLPGHGCTIRYQYGLFEQKIVDGNQVELPDNWLRDGFVWEYRKPDKSVDVKFYGNAYMREVDGKLALVHEDPMIVMAVPYDVPIVGYHDATVNTLRMWNAEVNRDFSDYVTLTQEQIHQRNQYREFVESITRYLYPDDSTFEGRRMRLIQEYFFVSAGVQSIVRHYKKTGMSIYDFGRKIGIHINDTHPALCVAELMRVLVDDEELTWEDAWAITRDTIAYTNHTIMPEALETWNVDMFRPLLPRIYMIIDEINPRGGAPPLSGRRGEGTRPLHHPGWRRTHGAALHCRRAQRQRCGKDPHGHPQIDDAA